MTQLLLYVLAGLVGVLTYRAFLKLSFRLGWRRDDVALRVVRGLDHDGFMRFKRIADEEAKRRQVA